MENNNPLFLVKLSLFIVYNFVPLRLTAIMPPKTSKAKEPGSGTGYASNATSLREAKELL